MAQITAVIDSFNSPQYTGELFSAEPTNTPLLSMIGGLTGGVQTDSEEFPTAVLCDYPEPKQPEISETAAIKAPEPQFLTRGQEMNVVQIFQETVEITYSRMANVGKMSGISQNWGGKNFQMELDWQLEQKLKIVARDVEHTFINGKYQKRSAANIPNKTRGLIELCTANAIDGAGASLTKDMLKTLYKEMADNGAYMDNMVIFVNSTQKEALTEIYSSQLGYALPATRNVGGLNIMEIENDFFKCGIIYNKFVPKDTLLLADVAHIAPVFQTIPGKGNLFLEELAKTGASEKHQLYGHIGLAHGPNFLHGVIKNLAC